MALIVDVYHRTAAVQRPVTIVRGVATYNNCHKMLGHGERGIGPSGGPCFIYLTCRLEAVP